MKSLAAFSSRRSMWASAFIVSAIIMYPNLGEMIGMWGRYLPRLPEGIHPETVMILSSLSFLFRIVMFAVALYLLIKLNVKHAQNWSLFHRIWVSLIVTGFLCSFLFMGVFGLGSYLHGGQNAHHYVHMFFPDEVGTAMLQGFIMWLAPVMIGYIYHLSMKQIHDEEEIERLSLESLQSRCDALTNQINPHFFFNSLSGLTYLIREDQKERSLEYVNKISGIFRYILQSEKKSIVPLSEELDFLNSYEYTLEVRYGDKFAIHVNVTDKQRASYLLPVLSLLPLVENIVKHNAIDSDNKMVATIDINDNEELVVSNPICPKLDPPVSNGIGLSNLDNRFYLQLGKNIRVENDGQTFSVVLPLKKIDGEESEA